MDDKSKQNVPATAILYNLGDTFEFIEITVEHPLAGKIVVVITPYGDATIKPFE